MGATGANPGREIDRGVHPGGRAQPNTSPIYGVRNSPGNMPSKLSEGTPATGTSRGSLTSRSPSQKHFYRPFRLVSVWLKPPLCVRSAREVL